MINCGCGGGGHEDNWVREIPKTTTLLLQLRLSSKFNSSFDLSLFLPFFFLALPPPLLLTPSFTPSLLPPPSSLPHSLLPPSPPHHFLLPPSLLPHSLLPHSLLPPTLPLSLTHSLPPSFTPSIPPSLHSDQPVTDIGCGDAHNCALTASGIVHSWGDNSAGVRV